MKKLLSILLILSFGFVFSCGKVEDPEDNSGQIENILQNSGEIEETNSGDIENNTEENNEVQEIEEIEEVVIQVNEEDRKLPVKEIIVDKETAENVDTSELETELENLFDGLLNDLN